MGILDAENYLASRWYEWSVSSYFNSTGRLSGLRKPKPRQLAALGSSCVSFRFSKQSHGIFLEYERAHFLFEGRLREVFEPAVRGNGRPV